MNEPKKKRFQNFFLRLSLIEKFINRELKMYKSIYGTIESREIEKFLLNFKLPNLPLSIVKYSDHFKVSNLLYTVSDHFEVSF